MRQPKCAAPLASLRITQSAADGGDRDGGDGGGDRDRDDGCGDGGDGGGDGGGGGGGGGAPLSTCGAAAAAWRCSLLRVKKACRSSDRSASRSPCGKSGRDRSTTSTALVPLSSNAISVSSAESLLRSAESLLRSAAAELMEVPLARMLKLECTMIARRDALASSSPDAPSAQSSCGSVAERSKLSRGQSAFSSISAKSHGSKP